MENLKKFVKTLNDNKANISASTELMYTVTPATDKIPAVKYYIKLRPVAQGDGTETLEFVARLQK